MPRQSLSVPFETRDALRVKDGWAANVFQDKERAVKRPGFSLTTAGAAPGQGIFNWTGSVVRVHNDVLKVGASSYTL